MYGLGIDIGTTFTAAAVWRDGRARICRLGSRQASIPSVVLLREDGALLVGEAAQRRAVTEPERVAREFKRRFGDSTPVLLAGTPFSAEALTAQILRSVVAEVTAREGAEPAAVCISHPANWGPFKTDLLHQTVRLADLDLPVRYVTEPEAAAVNYAQEQRLTVGDTIAVYDLGGGTFDAAVITRDPAGFRILGHPEGIERLGGMDVDAAVFDHVARTLGNHVSDLDEADPAAVSATGRLRQECTEAKEALSSDTDTSIPVLLPTVNTTVRITRAELETMMRPALHASISALRRALRSASIGPEDLAAVLLVGGSSRIPLVAQLVGAELGRPVAVDAEPKHDVALGAAWLAAERLVAAVVVPPVDPPPTDPVVVPPPTDPVVVPPFDPVVVPPFDPPPTRPVGPVPTGPVPTVVTQPASATPVAHRAGWTRWVAAAVGVAGLTVAAAAAYAVRPDDIRTLVGLDQAVEPTGPTSSDPSPTAPAASGPAASSARGTALAGGTIRPLTTAAAPPSTTAAAPPAAAPRTSATTTTRRTTATTTTRRTSSSTAASVPAAVTSVVASRNRAGGSTATSIQVSWDASPGATSYLVQWREMGGTGTGSSATFTGTSATLTGLLPATRYNIRVTPKNPRGSGPATAASGSTAR